LRMGDANLRFFITTVKDEWRKSAFLTRAWFPRTSLHNTWSVSPNGPPGWMFKETWPHSELMIYEKYRGKNTRPQCVKCLSLGAIWNFSKGTGLPWIDTRLWGTKGPSKGQGASGPGRFEPDHSYSYWNMLPKIAELLALLK
jgi:hypothetical protein